MRILKSDEHALMPAPVAVRGKRFWSIGILNYFAFDNPDILLTETEMWKETPSQFGSSPVVLDTGGFKPRGEFLVAGKCWAPRGETRAASQVSVRIGNMCKRLAVFGDRYWKTVSGVTTGITDPLPFSCMPIVWERAFGGAQYAWNAAGKGLVPEKDGAKQRLPLPNIERFDQLMGHPSDRPLPAGFGLIDPSWQPRSGRIGTCDAKWRDTVWPALPLDCDLRFFNWASDDQMLPDFFSGDEHFEILNMHPDYPRLTGRLPAFRQRVLIERMDAQTKDAKAFELPVNIDTVWLFPEIMRGIVIHRAVTEALFEDNRDILALHVVSERRDAPPRPFRELLMSADEHYAAKVNMPRNALFSGMAECDVFAPDYKDRLRTAQASMTRRTVKKAILGQLPRPVMSRPPREEHARLVAALDRQIAESEKLHNELNELIRANAQNSDAELVALEEGLELLRERRAALRDKGKNLPDASFGEVSPPIPRRGPWHDFFFQFVVACRRELEHRPELVKRLMAYGFDEEAIEENWFGYAASSRPCPLGALGLSAASLKELPQGLVVPRFRETELVAVSILPGWPEKPAGLAQAVMAPGSSCAPLHLRATLPGGPVLWVRNDFEALLADFLCGEFYETATLPVPGVSLEPALRDALSRAPSCHMLHVKGLHEAAEAQIQKLHPNLRREILPGGRTLCESAEQGNDVRAALLSFLSAEQMKLWDQKTALQTQSLALAYLAPALLPENAAQTSHAARTARALREETPLASSFKKGVLADLQAKLDKLPAHLAEPPSRNEALLLAREKKSLRGMNLSGLDFSNENLDGVDFSNATLERTIFSGASLRKSTFSSCAGFNADFTNADFSGAALSQCSFVGCSMRDALFSDANLNQTAFSGASLDKADFSGARLTLCAFSQCVLAGACFNAAQLELCAFHEDRIENSVWEEARIEGTGFYGVLLERADFSRCRIKNSAFADVAGSRALFRHAQMEGGHFLSTGLEENPKCVFSEADFSHADMTGGSFQQAFLYKADFTAARFDRCIMDKSYAMGACMPLFQAKESRFIESALDGSNMRYANLLGSSFTGTRLCGADLRDANLYCADMRNAVLGETDFSRANLGRTVIEGQGGRFRKKPHPDEEM